MEFERFRVVPVGFVRRDGKKTWIELREKFKEAAEGLREGDWIDLILWFDGSDSPERRSILKVHPYNNPKNPLTGVFATRSPVRPNPVALYTVRIEKMEEGRILIGWIDARDGTPVIDIKIFVERLDCPQRLSNNSSETIKEEELDIPNSVQIGEVNIIPSTSRSYLVLEIGERTTHLSADQVSSLIKALSDLFYRDESQDNDE